MNLSNEVKAILGEPTTDGPLGKLARKARRKRVEVPSCDDPKAELKRLVTQHKAYTRKAAAIEAMVRDRVSRQLKDDDGNPVTILANVAEDKRVEALALVKSFRHAASELESAITRELRKVPVYQHFLSEVFGMGPVVSAYLIATIDIQKATKPSNLRRFCGLAIIGGRLERPTRGVKLGYCAELRTRLFQVHMAMWKNAAKFTACEAHDAVRPPGNASRAVKDQFRALTLPCVNCHATNYPLGKTSKYLDIWLGYKHRMAHSERVTDDRIVRLLCDKKDTHVLTPLEGNGADASAKGFIHSTGWHKSADVLIEDLYIVWRALEGLPVWPSYYAAKLGYQHRGKITVQARMLTLEEALDVIGDVGGRPATQPVEDIAEDEEELAAE